MTTESEGTSEYTTLQSDGTEFDDYESGFVTASSQTDANEKETMEYYNGTIHQDNKSMKLILYWKLKFFYYNWTF